MPTDKNPSQAKLAFLAAVEDLPKAQREILTHVLKEPPPIDVSSIASKLGMAPSTLYGHVGRALSALGEKLEGDTTTTDRLQDQEKPAGESLEVLKAPDHATTSPPCGDSELVVEFDIPEGVADSEAMEQVSEVALLADALYRALGGAGLKLKHLEVHDDALVPEVQDA